MIQVEQVIEESQLCPFCLLWGIGEDEYNVIGPNFFGDQAEFAGITCCDACALAIEALDEDEQSEMLALVREQDEVAEVVYPDLRGEEVE